MPAVAASPPVTGSIETTSVIPAERSRSVSNVIGSCIDGSSYFSGPVAVRNQFGFKCPTAGSGLME